MYRRQLLRSITLFILVLWSISPAPSSVPPVMAQAMPGAIAYVRDKTGDEIRLIEPDGSNDRRLWIDGVADPHAAYHVYTMAWRPDGRELAFASTHENWCSINYSDVFAVGADGSGALAAYPTGTVRAPVKNVSFFGSSFTGFVYFQGAQHSAGFVTSRRLYRRHLRTCRRPGAAMARASGMCTATAVCTAFPPTRSHLSLVAA